jgi:hypothetical protein
VVNGTFTVSHDHVTLQMLTFQAGPASVGIVVQPAVTDFTLANAAVQGNLTGLSLSGHDATVTYSCFRNNTTGIGSGTLDTASIDHSYFAENTGSAIDLVGPGVNDVTVDSDWTRNDTHFLRAFTTVRTTVNLLNGDGGARTNVGNMIEFHNGNTGFELTHNFYKLGTADALFFTSDGGAANTGHLLGNQFVLNSGSGIQAANNGLDNTLIEFSFIKKNGGSGIRLDAASTGNTLEVNRLNKNLGIDCEDHTNPLANNWADSNRGDDATYAICRASVITGP